MILLKKKKPLKPPKSKSRTLLNLSFPSKPTELILKTKEVGEIPKKELSQKTIDNETWEEKRRIKDEKIEAIKKKVTKIKKKQKIILGGINNEFLSKIKEILPMINEPILEPIYSFFGLDYSKKFFFVSILNTEEELKECLESSAIVQARNTMLEEIVLKIYNNFEKELIYPLSLIYDFMKNNFELGKLKEELANSQKEFKLLLTEEEESKLSHTNLQILKTNPNDPHSDIQELSIKESTSETVKMPLHSRPKSNGNLAISNIHVIKKNSSKSASKQPQKRNIKAKENIARQTLTLSRRISPFITKQSCGKAARTLQCQKSRSTVNKKAFGLTLKELVIKPKERRIKLEIRKKEEKNAKSFDKASLNSSIYNQKPNYISKLTLSKKSTPKNLSYFKYSREQTRTIPTSIDISLKTTAKNSLNTTTTMKKIDTSIFNRKIEISELSPILKKSEKLQKRKSNPKVSESLDEFHLSPFKIPNVRFSVNYLSTSCNVLSQTNRALAKTVNPNLKVEKPIKNNGCCVSCT